MIDRLKIGRPFISFLVLTILIPASSGFAQPEDPDKILIRNVRLIDRTGQTEDRSVSILITLGKLDVITEDLIPVSEEMIVYDAMNGVVMGLLDIGQPANFMILDQDPRVNIELLLDTKAHTVFAILEGVVVTNTLIPTAVGGPEAEKKATRWIAYTPPPMALPVSYQDKSKWNRWETKPISGIFVSAVALDRQRWLTQDDSSKQQVGVLSDFEGGEIRAFRLGVVGTLNFKRPWVYSFIIATHAFDRGYDSQESDQISLLDYRLDIPVSHSLTFSIGKQKEPITMERLLLGTQLQMPERPTPIDAMFPFRNVGITVNGGAFDRRVAWAAGVFNDWFDDSQAFDESSSEVVGRISGLAWVTSDESNLVHLGFGFRYTDAKEPIQYRTTPEFNQAPLFVDTGPLDAESGRTYDVELSWRSGQYWLATEFVRSEVKAPQWQDPVFNGFHVGGSWVVTGEMRRYNRRNGTFGGVPVSKAVTQGGAGAWEVAARYSRLDLNEGPVEGGEVNIASLGLNWWPTARSGVSLNYRYIILDKDRVRGRSSGVMARLILMLE